MHDEKTSVRMRHNNKKKSNSDKEIQKKCIILIHYNKNLSLLLKKTARQGLKSLLFTLYELW